jgi:hypothetical protein
VGKQDVNAVFDGRCTHTEPVPSGALVRAPWSGFVPSRFDRIDAQPVADARERAFGAPYEGA